MFIIYLLHFYIAEIETIFELQTILKKIFVFFKKKHYPCAMKNALKIFISSVFAALSFAAIAQDNVSNIRVQQMDNVLIILYDLAEQADIEAFASFDGGVTYTEALQHVTGAVGKEVTPGVDKMVAWNVLSEFGEID